MFRELTLDGRLEHGELRQLADGAVVGAHLEQARDLTPAGSKPVKTNQFLQSIHVDPPHAHRDSASRGIREASGVPLTYDLVRPGDPLGRRVRDPIGRPLQRSDWPPATPKQPRPAIRMAAGFAIRLAARCAIRLAASTAIR